MKRLIRIREKGKPDIVKEIKIRDKNLLIARQRFHSTIHQDQTKILPRRKKHKEKFDSDDFFL